MIDEKKALVKTLERVLLNIRMLGYEGQRSGLSQEKCALVADLADAIHNIPSALLDEEWDANFHINIMLGGFEEKYKNQECIKPLDLYQKILKNEI